MKRGFTLIELLVVVAIIAILAAMLLPALNRAREQAKAASCQQNEKNLSMAMNMYSTDYGGYLTWHEHRSTTAGSRRYCNSVWWYELWTPYTDGIDVFFEPTTGPYTKGITVPDMTADRRDDFTVDYAWNRRAIYTGDATPRLSGDDIKFPSETVALTDHIKNWNATFALQYRTYVMPTSIDGGPQGDRGYRHNGYHTGGINFLFVDGHVKFFMPDKLGRDWYFGSSGRHWFRTRADL